MKLLIYETTGDWAAAWRREISSRATIVEIRILDDLFAELTQSPTAVVGFEISPDRVGLSATAVAQVVRRYPRALVVVLADRKLAGYEILLREVGVMHIVFSPRQVTEIAAIVERRLAAEPQNDFNAEGIPLEEQILARLPWSEI